MYVEAIYAFGIIDVIRVRIFGNHSLGRIDSVMVEPFIKGIGGSRVKIEILIDSRNSTF